MKNKLTSLELSKELDSLGVRVGSAFVWRNWYVNDETDRTIGTDYFLVPKDSGMMSITGDPKYDIPAYSVAELGEMLPSDVTVPETHEMCHMLKIETTGYGKYKKWYLSYGDRQYLEFQDTAEANARAKLLIYLIKNNLLDVTKLNV